MIKCLKDAVLLNIRKLMNLSLPRKLTAKIKCKWIDSFPSSKGEGTRSLVKIYFVSDVTFVIIKDVVKKKTDGLFSDSFKILLFFDYILTNALVEYQSRVQKKNSFTADEINIILCGAVKGYAALEAANIPNDKVRLRNIYFGVKDKQTNVKVIDSKLFPNANNITAVKNR